MPTRTVHQLPIIAGGNITDLDEILMYDGDTLVSGRITMADLAAYTTDGAAGSTSLSISATDTTPGLLEDKLVRGPGIIRTILNPGADEQIQIKLGPHYLSLASTGLYTGCEITPGATTGTIDCGAGEALYVDSTTDFSNITVSGVVIPAAVNLVLTNIATEKATYLSYSHLTTQYIQSPTEPTAEERRINVYIGVISHGNGVDITQSQIITEPEVALDVSAQVQDIMHALGILNLGGHVVTPNAAADLTWDKSAGSLFRAGANFANNPKDPHTVADIACAICSFSYRNQGFVEVGATTLIDPLNWDDGGVTTALSSNKKATIQYIYLFANGAVRVVRGQTEYADMNKALAAVNIDPVVIDDDIQTNGLLISTLVIRQNCTDLTDTTKAIFLNANKFGATGSVGSSATTTMQDAYENSVEPEILTNVLQGALSVRRGSALETDNVIEGLNNAGSTTFSVDGNGRVTGESFVSTDGVYISLASLKTTAAASATYADFQTAIAAL